MHSTILLLTLVSSAFAVPVHKARGAVNAPVDVDAPVNALVGAAVGAAAPVKAAVANVGAENVNVANGILSKNKVNVRGVANLPIDVDAPVKALVGVAANVKAPIDAAVANVGLKDIKGLNGIASGNKIDARQSSGSVVGDLPVVGSTVAGLPLVTDLGATLGGPLGTVGLKRGGLVDAPFDVDAPVKAAVGAAAKVFAPVDAAVANVKAEKVNAGNVIASGNEINARNDAGAGIANIPVDVDAPVKAAVGVAADVVAPVKAAVGNVGLKDVNIGNGILSGNDVSTKGDYKKVEARGGEDYGHDGGLVNAPVDVDAPVKALVGAAAKVVAPVEAAVGNVGLKNVNVLNGIASGNQVDV